MYRTLLRRLGANDQSVRRLLIAAMAIGFVSLFAAGIAAIWVTTRVETHTQWVNHTYEVEIAVANAGRATEQAETARRGYILALDPAYLDSYRRAAAEQNQWIGRIAALTADNPVQQRNVARLRAIVAGLTSAREHTNALVGSGKADRAATDFALETYARRMRMVRDLRTAMTGEEQRLLGLRDTEQRNSLNTFYVIIAVAGVLIVVVALITFLVVVRYTRELADSRDALRDFADSLEEQVAARTAALTLANEEIQRFAYIVSHDLRSPLVNVMGFTAELDAATASIAELIARAEARAPDIVTEEARLAAREDLPEAIGFIRTSTQKMDRLINAILRLSREGRRVLAPEPIDMAAMIGTIEASLRHLIDDRGAGLAIEGTLPAPVSDRLAIEQIFSNLIENALKYLQPGRPGRIVVRGSRDGARIAFEVEDNGRGIAPADHARIFDLFRRSGAQDQPGEGIGLAHVRALAYRLGGIIDVRSEPGAGATFRLSLPAAPTEM